MAERLPPAGVMVLAGLVLLATFFLPWRFDETAVFSWEAMRGVKGLRGFWPLVLLVAGFVAIVTARTRLPSFLRVVGCTLAGIAPILFVALFAPEAIPGHGATLGWRVPTGIAGLFVCATAFLHRGVHDGAFPKLVASVGAAAYLAAFLIPEGERILFVETVEAARDTAGLARVVPVAVLAGTVFSMLALVTWKPGYVGAWAVLVAWGMLLIVPAVLVAQGGGAWKHPAASLYPAVNLWAVSMLSAYGLAAIFSRITA